MYVTRVFLMKTFTRIKEIGCIFLIVVQLFIVRIKTHAQDGLQFDRAIFDTGTQNTGAILQDRDGFLWIGTNGAGLFRYDGYELKAYKPGGPNALSSPYVYALYEDRDGTLWIGTGGNGLARYDKETDTFTYYQHDPQNPQSISSDSIEFSHIQIIQEDPDERLWV